MTGHVIHATTQIHASPEIVWDVITDIPHLADVLGSVRSVRLLTEGEYDVGTTWREQRTFFGHHGEEELHVTESDPPRRTQVETRLRHDTITTAYTIQVGQDGTTKLMVTATMDVRDRGLAERVMWNALGGMSFSATRKMLHHDLDDIRHEAEARSGGADSGRHRAS